MTTGYDDFDKMKRAWHSVGNSIERGNAHSPTELSRKTTALDRLRNRYQRFSIASALLIFGSFMIFSRGELSDSPWNLYLGIAYAVYFATAAVMDFVLWKGVGTINPVEMSVTEVASLSLHYRKRHLQCVAVLLPFAIAILAFTAYAFIGNTYFLYGIFAGTALGAVIGSLQFRRFMSDYRKLSE